MLRFRQFTPPIISAAATLAKASWFDGHALPLQAPQMHVLSKLQALRDLQRAERH